MPIKFAHCVSVPITIVIENPYLCGLATSNSSHMERLDVIQVLSGIFF